MPHPIFPFLVALSYAAAPNVDLSPKSKDPISAMKTYPALILIADSHGGEDPDGDDPHGNDPHNRGRKDPDDQRHDREAPANQDRDRYPGYDDPYHDSRYIVPQPQP